MIYLIYITSSFTVKYELDEKLDPLAETPCQRHGFLLVYIIKASSGKEIFSDKEIKVKTLHCHAVHSHDGEGANKQHSSLTD